MNGPLPQPINTLELDKSCMFPWEVERRLWGEVYSRTSLTLIFCSSSSTTIPRDRLGVPAGSRIQAVSFLRCANGANIELFEFYSPDQREEFPRPSDVGIQHLALYVDDLDAAAEHLRRHGVNLMSGPNPLPGAEAGEGNRFIYARTPWGLTVELISYPASMAYEQHSEARRWRPMPTAES
jgi:catechol 2,3-dioxygenase-like lactoylglutathione lyase family enzyme